MAHYGSRQRTTGGGPEKRARRPATRSYPMMAHTLSSKESLRRIRGPPHPTVTGYNSSGLPVKAMELDGPSLRIRIVGLSSSQIPFPLFD